MEAKVSATLNDIKRFTGQRCLLAGIITLVNKVFSLSVF